jgi:hypothetical protein
VVAALSIELERDGFLDVASTRAGLVVLAAFLLSFLFIRASARLMRSPRVTWWPGSIETEGGLQVHHLAFGIVLLLAAGFALALQPASPWLEIAAAGFGIGAGLTLDEYALWLHLEDVCWAEEGRRSVDAVVVAALVGRPAADGLHPVLDGRRDADDPRHDRGRAGHRDRRSAEAQVPARRRRDARPDRRSRGRRPARQARVAIGAPVLRAREREARPRDAALRAARAPLPALPRHLAGALAVDRRNEG